MPKGRVPGEGAAEGFHPFSRTAVAVVMWAVAWVISAPACAVDLDEAMRLARDHDVQLRIARSELAAQFERVPQARAALLPNLSAQVGAQAGRFDSDIGSDPRYQNVTAGLNLGVPIYRPAHRVVVDQADLALLQAEVALERAGQDLVARVAAAYLDVLSALDTVEAAVAQRRAIRRQFELARRNYEVGTATIIDQQEAQARLDLNLAQLAAARNALAIRRAMLRQLTGRDETGSGVGEAPESPGGERSEEGGEEVGLSMLPENAPLPALGPDDVGSWVTRARVAAHAIRLAEQSVAIAQAEIRRAAFAHHPVIELTSQAQRIHGRTATTINWPGSRTNALAIGLQLTIPIFSGGSLSARDREAVAALGRSEGELELARRQVEQQTREAFYAWRSSQEQARALAAAVRSSELALESNRVGYRVGARINVDVLNAQQQLYETYRDHARARYDVLLNGLRLKAAAGELTEDDLHQVNALLTPRANRTFSAIGAGTASGPGPSAPARVATSALSLDLRRP